MRYRLGTLVYWMALGLPVGCAPVGGPDLAGGPDAPPPAVLDAPPIREGLRTESEAAQVARLLTEGEADLVAGRFDVARDRALEVEARFPEALGSGAALWLRARAAAGLGDWEDAALSSDRYLRLYVPGAERAPPPGAILLLSESLWRSGGEDAVSALFAVPTSSEPEVLAQAAILATTFARAMETVALRTLLADAPDHPRIVAAFMVELAVRRYLLGDEAEARVLAGDALALAPPRSVAERAMRVLEGRVSEELGVRTVIGAIVPGSGSPVLQRLTQEIHEGIEIALAVEGQLGLVPPELVLLADDGDPSRAEAAIRTLEEREAVGVIGPFLDGMVDAAARARVGALPMISPTAETLPPEVPGVLSLAGLDPEAARTLARVVLDQGVLQVVVLHPAVPDMYQEAAWFREVYEEGGGVITRSFTYPAGTTGFGPHLEEVARMAPPGLVVLLPPGASDLELLAPQIAFYQVRGSSGLLLFGNEAWTFSTSLDLVQTQHTNGVLSVTSWPERGSFGPGWSEFVSLYESHFQRTLRSPTPALGYDAARLLITAARTGGGHPVGTEQGLQRIRDFPGATGILSVQDGQIVRRFFPVRIDNRRLIAITP